MALLATTKTKKETHKMGSSNEIMKYFGYSHLPEHLQEVSKQFHTLADYIDQTLPDGPEKSVALRKLLEGKDAAVRAAIR